MPSWLRSYLSRLGGALTWFDRWAISSTLGWLRWVDSTLHGLVDLVYKTYILLTYDLQRLSWNTGNTTRTIREWVVWLAYTRIPAAYYAAVAAAWRMVATEAHWRRYVDAQNLRYLIALIGRVATILLNDIRAERRDRLAEVAALRKFLLGFIAYIAAGLSRDITNQFHWTQKQLADLRSWANAQFDAVWKYARSILPAVDKEAAAGYDATRPGRAGLLATLLDDLATDNPVVRGLITRLATLLLDLAELDDPLLRILAGKLLSELISHLGADKLAGSLVSDLLGAFLGGGPPKTLKTVAADIGGRLNTSEAQWQQFYAHGGDDVEHLGDQMRQAASPLFLLPLGAYFAAAVADPAGTAAATDDVLTPAARAALAPVLAALGG